MRGFPYARIHPLDVKIVQPQARPGLAELRQSACKPGSVWRGPCGPHVTAIPLGRSLPTASSNQPGRRPGDGPGAKPVSWRPRVIPIRFCSRWGLPCRSRYRQRGALLPHPFTLTHPRMGGLLSVALSLGSPPPDVIRHRVSMEPGLSSPMVSHGSGRPADWRASHRGRRDTRSII